MILNDIHLEDLMVRGLIDDPDYTMINRASIDIRVGRTAICEQASGRFEKIIIPSTGLVLDPGDFVLVDTWESFNVPNGYALEIMLKSSTARRGFNHLKAGWVDPGYCGIPTMEIKNSLQFNSLRMYPNERFAQVVVHQLIGPAQNPYNGRYQNAKEVEEAKDSIYAKK